MSSLFAEQAMLADGWERNVRFDLDAGGSIASVTADADPGDAERAGGPVIPGMADLHSHAFQRAMAGLAERRGIGISPEDDFWSWRETMYGLVERLGPEQLHAVAAWLYVELLRGGFTSVAEFHYLHRAPDGASYDDPAETSVQVIEAARRAGIGITHLPVLYARGGFDGEPLSAAQKRFFGDVEFVNRIVDELRRRFDSDPGVRLGIAPHSLRAVSIEDIESAVSTLHSADGEAPVHIHVAEQPREVEECVAKCGMRPVEYLLDEAPVDGRWCLVHATHVTENESDRLASSDATAGLCPTTEANLGDGVFPLQRFLESRGRYGVGTDSHVGRTAAEELRWLEYGQRLTLQRRIVAASQSRPAAGAALWVDAARGGEAATARPIGELAPGKRADLVVLDESHPDLAGLAGDALLDAMVFSSGADCIRHVMVGGRWRIRDGRHPQGGEIADAYRDVVRQLRG